MADSFEQRMARIEHALERAMVLTDNHVLGEPDDMPTPSQVHVACSWALEELAALRARLDVYAKTLQPAAEKAFGVLGGPEPEAAWLAARQWDDAREALRLALEAVKEQT